MDWAVYWAESDYEPVSHRVNGYAKDHVFRGPGNGEWSNHTCHIMSHHSVTERKVALFDYCNNLLIDVHVYDLPVKLSNALIAQHP